MRLNVMLMTDVTGRGGAEKALVDLALRLDRGRYNVTVCATRSEGNYQPLLDEAGVRTVVLARSSRLQTYKMLDLARMLKREPVHILHTHLFGSNTWGRILGKLAGVPVIIAHEHWSSKSGREVWVDRLLYRLSDRILAPSEASRRAIVEMEGIPARRISVVYNGVDREIFTLPTGRDVAREELGVQPGDLLVGTVGRLSPEKGGVDNLIRAVSSLRSKHPNLRLVIVGDGPLRVELEEVAASVGESTVFTGTRPDVARLLGAMDIFVLPSLKEAMPIALLEAMAVGLPSVSTTVGGVPEIVRDGIHGLLVPPGDAGALEHAIERLVTDRSLAASLRTAGRARVMSCFTIEQMVRRVETLYERLAERKGLGEIAKRKVQNAKSRIGE